MLPRLARDRQAPKEVYEEKEKIKEEKRTTSSECSSEDNKNDNSESDTIKKEDFRKYLESDGILDFVTRKLIGLYKQNDKPSGDQYMKNNFNGKEAKEEKKNALKYEKEKQKMQEKVEKLKNISNQYDSLKAEYEDLKKKNAVLE